MGNVFRLHVAAKFLAERSRARSLPFRNSRARRIFLSARQRRNHVHARAGTRFALVRNIRFFLRVVRARDSRVDAHRAPSPRCRIFRLVDTSSRLEHSLRSAGFDCRFYFSACEKTRRKATGIRENRSRVARRENRMDSRNVDALFCVNDIYDLRPRKPAPGNRTGMQLIEQKASRKRGKVFCKLAKRGASSL